jgi:hypothetical protein
MYTRSKSSRGEIGTLHLPGLRLLRLPSARLVQEELQCGNTCLVCCNESLLKPGGLGRPIAVNPRRLVLHARHRLGPLGWPRGRLQ